MSHAGNSAEQLTAEAFIRNRFAAARNQAMVNRRVPVSAQASMQVDAVSDDDMTFCEIFARIGELKPGQKHKLKGDVLKLTRIRAVKGPEVELFILVASEPANTYLQAGWIGDAVSAARINVKVIPLPPELESAVQRAQKRQFR